MSVLLLPPIFQFFDNNGDPLANGFVYTYAAGTTTPLATFTSAAGTTEAPNPIELNAAGRPSSGSGAIWGEGAYKFIVTDSNGVQVGDTLDNVISFNSLAEAANAYAETFSGDGEQTVFTTSEDLGTDEKDLLVFVGAGLQEIAVNGTFDADEDWTKGVGWTIGSGVATATGAISTAISQVPTVSLVPGQAYSVNYTITRSAGSLTASLGGYDGVARSATGTYREVIVAASSTPIAFTGAGFTGTLDNVSITPSNSGVKTILPVSGYTIDGTSLTFASAPPVGVGNIDVRAPSLLLGAATTAANLAQLYAAQALASEMAAETFAAAAALATDWRPAADVATTANITLSGEQTIDGVLTSASRVLVKDQTSIPENGIYISDAGAWTRATDADTWDELVGLALSVSGGTINTSKNFSCTIAEGGTLESTDVTFTEILFPKREIDVFLIGGQSNAQGSSNDASNGPDLPSGIAYQYYSSAISALTGDPVGNASDGSAWPSFAQHYYEATGRKICFVPAAVGGSDQSSAAGVGATNWDVSGTLFDASIVLLEAALTALAAQGWTPTIKGVLWCQGENDAGAIGAATITKATYKTALSTMIGRYRSEDINGATYAQMPFYISLTGGPFAGDSTGYQQVREAQQEVADADLYTSVGFANAVDFIARGLMQSAGGETLHYTQAGYNEMGQFMANHIVTGGALSIPTAGVWTPGFTTDGTAGTPAYSVQSGSFLRLGDIFIGFYAITLSNWTGSPSGNVSINGLPFTVNGSFGGGAPAFYGKIDLGNAAYSQLGVLPVDATKTAQLRAFGSGTAVNSALIDISDVATTATIGGTIIYRVS